MLIYAWIILGSVLCIGIAEANKTYMSLVLKEDAISSGRKILKKIKVNKEISR